MVRLSIITPSFNQARYLEETIRSVLSQRDQVHEYFVLDGGSSDGSADVIRKYADRGIDYWISEKDKGQTDAIARGFARATGDYLAWVNSDDVYLPGALAKVRAALEANPSADLISGWHVKLDAESRVLSAHRIARETRRAARWGVFHPHQPTVFFRRSLYEKVGPIRQDLHLVLDTELWYRMIDAGATWGHVPDYLAGFRKHIESKGVGNPRGYDEEYAFLTHEFPHYHAPTLKHYVGRAVGKLGRILKGDELASRRDSRRWAGRNVEEVFGQWRVG